MKRHEREVSSDQSITETLRGYEMVELLAATRPDVASRLQHFAQEYGPVRGEAEKSFFLRDDNGYTYQYDRPVLCSYTKSGTLVAVWATSGRMEGDPRLQYYVVTGNAFEGEPKYRRVDVPANVERLQYGHQLHETTLLMLEGAAPARAHVPLPRASSPIEHLIYEKHAALMAEQRQDQTEAIMLGAQGCTYRPHGKAPEALDRVEALLYRVEEVRRLLGSAALTGERAAFAAA